MQKIVETCYKKYQFIFRRLCQRAPKRQEQEEKDVTSPPSIKSEQEKIDLHESVKKYLAIVRFLPTLAIVILDQPLKYSKQIVSFV